MGLLYLLIVPCGQLCGYRPKPQAADVTVEAFHRVAVDSRKGSEPTAQVEFGKWQNVTLENEIGHYLNYISFDSLCTGRLWK